MPQSPNFYTKSLTLAPLILNLIDEGLRESEIAKELKLSKQRVSYHVSKLKVRGYVKENGRDVFKLLEITQPGKNFLAMYQDLSGTSMSICRAENIRFKAPVYKMPSSTADWHRVEMNNWVQYTTEVDSIKIKLNGGNSPTIEFIPAPVEGNDPIKLYCSLILDCSDAAKNLEQTLGILIGRPELSSKGEWIIYNPLAKTITEYAGRVTVDGVGAINASLPNRVGEFEFYNPRAAAEFLEMPRRVARLERDMKKLLQHHNVLEPN